MTLAASHLLCVSFHSALTASSNENVMSHILRNYHLTAPKFTLSDELVLNATAYKKKKGHKGKGKCQRMKQG